MKPRYLTKSRFKLARECPTKLFYTAKPDRYVDTKGGDSFLQALANGGHQVGELAKHYYPGGTEVVSLEYDTALAQTNELLAHENVVIYEAAIRYNNLFIRVDVLVKSGQRIKLVEVKAKSAASSDINQFVKKDGTVTAKWKPYLEDIAFQTFVVRGALPGMQVTSSLMLVDKRAKAPTTGLNQKFRVIKDEHGRNGITTHTTLTLEDLSERLLVEIPVDELAADIIARPESAGVDFKTSIATFAHHYSLDQRIASPLGNKCKQCEFRVKNQVSHPVNISGFDECWGKHLDETHLHQPLVIDLWNFKKSESLIKNGRLRLIDVTDDDLTDTVGPLGLSDNERQRLQIDKCRDNDNSSFTDVQGLRESMSKWAFPLNFIDFETSTAAIPFHKGQKPYDQIAFQFSHHTIDGQGKIEHANEYINAEPGEFPNFTFVRALMLALEANGGTIFRYHNHENTVLVRIAHQLKESPQSPPDADVLIDFIKSITSTESTTMGSWCGERNMIDLQRELKHWYYNPLTGGSNSLKAVLPAILNSSKILRDKYSMPIYGTAEMPSCNFSAHRWLEPNGLADPYNQLPTVFDDTSKTTQDYHTTNDIQEGGAALAAYGYLQIVEMSADEREKIEKALLRYCELDTLAMVMVYELFSELVGVGS
jgi:hypothetical protein